MANLVALLLVFFLFQVLCNLFYEASTRTSGSFEAAMKKLGGDVVLVNQSGSSISKGESLPDTSEPPFFL